MTILVTGATGLLGSHLCRRLVSEGYPVMGLMHKRVSPLIVSLQESEKFKVCVGDIRDGDFVDEVVKGYKVKTVFHMAAQMPYSQEKDFVGANICGTLNLWKSSRLNGVEEFIYASSMSVYSDPPAYLPVDESHPTEPSTIYGVTKLASESVCKCYRGSMRGIIIRYAGMYGIGMDKARAIAKFVRCALNNQPLTVFSGGNQSNDFVYVDDAVEGTLLAWKKKESALYNIGSGQETAVTSLASKIVELVGSQSQIVFSSDETDRPFRFVLDIAKARNTLGYSPHSVDDGLGLYIEDVKSECNSRGGNP